MSSLEIWGSWKQVTIVLGSIIAILGLIIALSIKNI